MDAKPAAGVNLSDNQRTLVSSVLSLFAGHPTKQVLSTWADDATFNDPLTTAKGRKEFEAQWVGLAAAFSKIDILEHEVVNSGNPIVMNSRIKYTLKGLGTEKTIQSVVDIHTVGEEGTLKISRVDDKWDGQIPDGPIANAFRKLNAKTVPLMTGEPKE